MVIISNHALRDRTGLLPMRPTCGCSYLGLYIKTAAVMISRLHSVGSFPADMCFQYVLSMAYPILDFETDNSFFNAKYLLSKRDLAVMIR